ncbi:glycosyltransferase family 2 protein [Aestuariirhabdus litorea]|uniref:Glycosyltransferase family 2 protein n=1 Tax=Aestuariirhabdus litorea TaxID=2528527 RepID=A0A3P3VM97_9GAMM|nr:glycosyltransferase family 2 protein [Aestuariirhabdus litorea]RRJ83891.1 glycosyltransferase family 2 protein [Aestuariirhabdus litorea]RWW97113.1 glycosyltransferase [Endozoicomonadaceae bacterium GTF-13]
MPTISVVLPAKNEAEGLKRVLPALLEMKVLLEIIVVDDGSEDDTAKTAADLGVTVICHPYSMGNGAAIKTGARAATGEVIVFMDGDGQHQAKDIPALLAMLEEGYDMVVGARSSGSQASVGRWAANSFYNRLASLMVGHKVEDLTSGFRAVRADRFREFLYLLPNGFSYPTTSTMAFFRAGYSVGYYPITALKREGKSHINLLRDGVRFLLIIFKIGTLYSPLKLYLPVSVLFFLLGSGYYLYTFLAIGRFTNMSALLLSTSVIIFLIGLVSEQITSLMYQQTAEVSKKDKA